MPNFFKTLFRRKLVIWFLIAEVLRNVSPRFVVFPHTNTLISHDIQYQYWLSAPYGRNWAYLWSNVQVPTWAIVVMIAIFFVGIWGLLMGLLIRE